MRLARDSSDTHSGKALLLRFSFLSFQALTCYRSRTDASFQSPYSDEPEDPKENTDKGSYCFVGKHTTDESKDYSESMNTFPCDEAGCWEDASEDDASEEMVVDA